MMDEKRKQNIFTRGLVGNDRRAATLLLTEMAALTAIVIILQLLGSFIHLFGMFSISLVLVPIVIGAALYGPFAGAWLGLVFGAVVLLSGDAAAFLTIDPFGTVLTVLLKGFLCGFVAGLVFRLIEKKNRVVAVFAAAAVCPIVNTGIFFLGCLLFFLPDIRAWGASQGYANAASYMFIGLAGANFLFEFGFNLVLAPALHRLLILLEKVVRNRRK